MTHILHPVRSPRSLLAALLGGLALTACSSGGAPTPPSGGVTTGDAVVRARLANCAVVTNSADPAASDCLVGTYAGRTLSGDACSLEVRANGAYDYRAPNLTYTYTPTARTLRVFGHHAVGGDHQVVWLISDPIQASDAFDLDFQAVFGPNADALGKKIEVKAEKITDGGGRVSSTCLVPI